MEKMIVDSSPGIGLLIVGGHALAPFRVSAM